MKTTLKPVIFLTLFIILFFTQCKKNKNELPPETQEGKNTFGCLVNGELFLPKGSLGFSSTPDCQYQYIYPSPEGYFFHVGANDKRDANDIKSVSINIDSLRLYTGLVVSLNQGQMGISGVGRSVQHIPLPNYTYYTNKAVTGMLTITKFDEVNQIVAGTFWFNAVNSFNDTVHITQGRFDTKYTK